MNGRKLRSMKRTMSSVVLSGALLMTQAPQAFAVPEDDPTASDMAADLLFARPAGAVVTVLGSAFFVLTLPFSAAGGNLNQAAETLVVGPARETFVRCLGCINSGRYHKADGAK